MLYYTFFHVNNYRSGLQAVDAVLSSEDCNSMLLTADTHSPGTETAARGQQEDAEIAEVGLSIQSP